MYNVELLIIGAGPAGLSAAISAASQGVKVLVCERNFKSGGQLVKQTHKFFGSEKQHAGERGYIIGNKLIDEVNNNPNITLLENSTVVSVYEDKVYGILSGDKFIKIKPQKVIVATGASENFLTFKGNDIPGVYGAGAVQTLMNVHGVKPAKKVLMVGSGNIGLIVSYQLMQAGVEVVAIVEASNKIGGYLVHASKLRRCGVPILTSSTILEAYGTDCVTGAKICSLDNNFNPIVGTEKYIECDAICLAVGLSPLVELIWQAGCKMMYSKQLSGYVPLTDSNLKTSDDDIYAAGDSTGIEEASSAMVEGKIAGYSVAINLGYNTIECEELRKKAKLELDELRSGDSGEKIRLGLEKLNKKEGMIHVNLEWNS